MKNYEQIEIQNTNNLKQPTIYFYLKENGFSEHYISNLRNSKDSIILNDKPVTIREKIKTGDILQIAQNPNSNKTNIMSCNGSLDILYEDDDYLIVNKPHNLACTPTRSHYSNNLGGQICGYMSIKTNNFVLRILNRLDRETAGIVIVAKNLIAYSNMKDLKKEYHAICSGIIESDFTINKPILTITNNGINEIKRVISEKGKQAITHVKVLKQNTNKNFSLVSLTLETGRTHQIRVHLSNCSHHLLGDTLYGNIQLNEKLNLPHTMLLLKQISFTHFRTGKSININVDYPQEWLNFI